MGIRRAQADDVEAVEHIVQAAYEKYLNRGLRPGPVDDDYRSKVDAGEIHVIEDGGRIVGLIGLLCAEDHVLIENVAVAPGCQHQGFGRRLLAFADEWAADHGIDELRLYTHQTMTENIALYRSLGWVEQERKVQDGFNRVFFTKRIGAALQSQG